MITLPHEKNKGPLIRPHEKAGTTLLVESTVQQIFDDDLKSPTVYLAEANRHINDTFANTIAGRYARAVIKRQLGGAAVIHTLLPDAMTHMRDVHSRQGSLKAPDAINKDYFKNIGINVDKWHQHPAHDELLKSTYWMLEGMKQPLQDMQNKRHEAHPLYYYLDEAREEYNDIFPKWKKGPGRNRWPSYADPTPDSATWVKWALHNNIVNFSASLLGAKAVHHLIHSNPRADHDKLTQVVSLAVESIGWMATENRHLGWKPDWQKQKHVGLTPLDGAISLTQCPVNKIIEPNDYDTSIDGKPIMQRSEFYSHALSKDGPIVKAAACNGIIFRRVSPPVAPTTRVFFEELGFHPNNGDCYSPVSVALAMGFSALKSFILPVYEENRLKGLNADQ